MKTWWELQNGDFILSVIGGAEASAEAVGGARGGAEEAQGWEQSEGGEPQQSWGRGERWDLFY